MKRFFLLLSVLSSLMALSVAFAQSDTPAVPEVLQQNLSWQPSFPITTDSNAPFGAGYPVIATAPNHTVMVGYLRLMSDDEANTDLYYRTSTNNGLTWANPAVIHSSLNQRSAQLDLAYSNSNVAHAVWVENSQELHYAPQTSWPTSTNLTPASTEPLSDPKIVFSDNGRLNLIWSEQQPGGGLKLFFLRSENSGSTWWSTPRELLGTFTLAARPDMVVVGNTVHVVWEDGIPGFADVYYVRGTVNENTDTVTWTTPANLSARTGAINAKQAQIIRNGTTLHVSFTDRIARENQTVHYLSCAASCELNTNWQLPAGNNPNISGAVLGVTESFPFDVISTLAANGGCVLAYFHGYQIGGSFPEQVMGTNSCSNWSQSPRDIVTSINVRSANPEVTVDNNWWVYLVYEEKDIDAGSGDPSQVRFVRNEPAIYLPVIAKP